MTSKAAGESDTKNDRLIADYLRELKVSAWIRQLPRSQTASLETEVRAKIEAALAAAGARDEATVYGVLDRLGPPSEFVTKLADQPRTGTRGAIDTVLAPMVRLRDVHGWGLAEIGALLLLMVGPFYVWWVGPIFGIILVRVAADRWTAQATHRATYFVVVLFAIQALIAVGLFVYVLIVGGPFAEQLQRIIEDFTVGGRGRMPLVPWFGGVEPLSPIQLLLASPPYIAGIASGVYLALSPRHRPRPMV